MERLSELLGKFEKLDRQLKEDYSWKYRNIIDEIFNNYRLVRIYKNLLKGIVLIPIGSNGKPTPEGKSIREEREREKERLKKEIEGKGISLEDHPIIVLINEIILLKKEIKKYLYYYASVVVDTNITNKLRNIRNDRGYFIDNIYDDFRKKIELKDDGFDEGIDYLTNMYDPEECARRVVKVGAFIISKNFPDIILYHIVNLKECFAIGLFQASLFYCRTFIESAGFEFLKRKGKLKSNINNDKVNMSDIIYQLKQLINDKVIFYKIKEVINIANKSLHQKDHYHEVNEEEAFEAIKTTFGFIEQLYRC
jgi:hypothetical protein